MGVACYITLYAIYYKNQLMNGLSVAGSSAVWSRGQSQVVTLVEALTTARTGVTIPCRLPEGHTKK